MRVRAAVAPLLSLLVVGCGDSESTGDGGALRDASIRDAGPVGPFDGAGALDAQAAKPDSGTPPPAPCTPPNYMMVAERCLPSCGVAGGNQCLAPDSTLCDGLPPLESYDCAVCCARPAYPGPVGIHSFHFVYDGDQPYWDSILALGAAHPEIMFVADVRPPEITLDRWAKSQHTTVSATGAEMARNINTILVDAVNAPAMVMVDELNGGTVAYVDELARTMRDRYPQWEGRWGVFSTVFTPPGPPAVDSLLLAHAHIASERYFTRDDYCAAGSTGGARDIALAAFFDGDATLDRFHWLTVERARLASRSPLTVLFGVTDRYMTGTAPAVFLDRMFYVWATRTRHPEVLDIANGSVGAWKWTPRHVDGGFGTSNTSRDLAFSESVQWYGVDHMRASRLGPVACP